MPEGDVSSSSAESLNSTAETQLLETPAPQKRTTSATSEYRSPSSRHPKRRRLSEDDAPGLAADFLTASDVDVYLRRYLAPADRETAARLCEAGLVLALCSSGEGKSPAARREIRGLVSGIETSSPRVSLSGNGQVQSVACSCGHELLWCPHVGALLLAAAARPSAAVQDVGAISSCIAALSREQLEAMLMTSVLECTPYTPRLLSALGFAVPAALSPPSPARKPPAEEAEEDDSPAGAEACPYPLATVPTNREAPPRLLFAIAPVVARVTRAVDACLASRERYRACPLCPVSELPSPSSSAPAAAGASPRSLGSFAVQPSLVSPSSPSSPSSQSLRRRPSVRWELRYINNRAVPACPSCGTQAEERCTPARLGPIVSCVAELLEASGRLWDGADAHGSLSLLEACTDTLLSRWAELGPASGHKLASPSIPAAVRAAAPAACAGAEAEGREAVLEALATTWQSRVLDVRSFPSSSAYPSDAIDRLRQVGLARPVRRRFAAALDSWAGAGGDPFRLAAAAARAGWDLPALDVRTPLPALPARSLQLISKQAIARGDKAAVRELGPSLRQEEAPALLELRARYMAAAGKNQEALWLAKYGGLPALAARARFALGKVESAVLGALTDVEGPRELLQLAALARPHTPAGALWLAARALRFARPAPPRGNSPRAPTPVEHQEPCQGDAARALLDFAVAELRRAMPEGVDDTPLRTMAAGCAARAASLSERDAFVLHATFLEPPAEGVPPSPEEEAMPWEDAAGSPSLSASALVAQRVRGMALLGIEAACRLVARDTRSVFDLWTCACILQHTDIHLAWAAARSLVARCSAEPASFLATFATQDKLMQLIEWCIVSGGGEAGLSYIAEGLYSPFASVPPARSALVAAFRARRLPHFADGVPPAMAPAAVVPVAAAAAVPSGAAHAGTSSVPST
eukprot:tig00001041_g6567.t1